MTQGQGKLPLAQEEAKGSILLIADLLENAQRRSREGRYADAVLRSYRAVEAAVQLALLQRGQNPWNPRVSLEQGCQRLRELGVHLTEEMNSRLKSLQQSRNYSFPEHGYNPVDGAEATSALENAHALAEVLVNATIPGADLAQERKRLAHCF